MGAVSKAASPPGGNRAVAKTVRLTLDTESAGEVSANLTGFTIPDTVNM